MFQTHLRKVHLFAWLIYSLITFWAVWNHEPNRDEAQVWLIVRDFDIAAIYSELSAMGHPGLWYFILLPFAKLGFPYFTMLVAHWFIGVAAAWLLLFRSNLETGVKMLFLFSYYLLFEYMVPARNYNLTLLLLFLIAANYKKRFTHSVPFAVFVFLLFNANTQSFGAAVALLLIFVWDARKSGKLKKVIPALTILLSGLALFILQMLPALNDASGNVTVRASFFPEFNFNSLWVCTTAIQNAFIPVTPEFEELKIALFFTLIFLFFIFSLIRTLPVMLFMLTSVSWLFYLFSTKLSGSWRHEGLLLIFAVFSIWISAYYEKKDNYFHSKISNFFDAEAYSKFFLKFLACCFFITIIFGIKSISKEIKFSYSGAEEAAAFLKEKHFSEVAAYPSWRATSLAPYLPDTKFWQIERNEYGTAYKLDSTFDEFGNSLSDAAVIERLKNKYDKVCILILNAPLNDTTDSYSAEFLFQNDKSIWGSDDETFFIYSVRFH